MMLSLSKHQGPMVNLSLSKVGKPFLASNDAELVEAPKPHGKPEFIEGW
jgi:hypothetical protein